MKRNAYLFDTHALIFWNNKESVSEEFIEFFDEQNQQGRLYISSISFWEVALLVKKGSFILRNNAAVHQSHLNGRRLQNRVVGPFRA